MLSSTQSREEYRTSESNSGSSDILTFLSALLASRSICLNLQTSRVEQFASFFSPVWNVVKGLLVQIVHSIPYHLIPPESAFGRAIAHIKLGIPLRVRQVVGKENGHERHIVEPCTHVDVFEGTVDNSQHLVGTLPFRPFYVDVLRCIQFNRLFDVNFYIFTAQRSSFRLAFILVRRRSCLIVVGANQLI